MRTGSKQKKLNTEGREVEKIKWYFEDPVYREILLAKNKKELKKAISNMEMKHPGVDVTHLLNLLDIKESQGSTKFLPLLLNNNTKL